MANFAVDPRPFVPPGFTLIHREVVHAPVRMISFLAFSLDKVNEDLAIAVTVPPVAKEDFSPFARELHRFLIDNRVLHPEIQPCPMGEAFVRFDSPMQRDSFVLSDPRPFLGYQLRFIRHDEGINFRDLDLDRVVWFMMLCFPADAKNLTSLVDKSIAGFGQLLHIHGSCTLGRLVVKVLVNKDANVPESVTLSAGSEPRIRTWTVPIFLLHASDVILGGDEQPLPVDGLIHPMLPQAPRWMGSHGYVLGAGHVVDNQDAGSGNGDGNGSGNPQGAAQAEDDIIMQEAVLDQQDPEQGVNMSGDSAEPEVSGGVQGAVSPSTFLNQVITFNIISPPALPIFTRTFCFLSQFIIDLSTDAPSYFSDKDLLWYLAKVLLDPSEVSDLGRKRKLVDVEAGDAEDDELRIISKEEMVVKTPRKRRARKLKAPLCEKFVRRSRRINKSQGDFHGKASAEKS
ncbi:unnamed protein product [Urochloa humidicola]